MQLARQREPVTDVGAVRAVGRGGRGRGACSCRGGQAGEGFGRGPRRFARSIRATVSAGITSSWRSRQANTTNVATAPTKASATSHQMCQIIPKPTIVAKNAQTKPVGLLRGISIGW